jgi:capsular polysaccharide export protein
MTGRIAVFSPGLLRLKDEIRSLSNLDPHFAVYGAQGFDAVAGWGHKPTADRARRIAARGGKPYIAFEDGFLRSLKPGTSQRPVAMVMDRTGIYYDARGPSDLEIMLETAEFTSAEHEQARTLLDLIARHRLSKYNHGADRLDVPLDNERRIVIVIDQTAGDESIAGALSDASTFETMAEAAAAENPGALVIAKLHPETLSGTKKGYIADAARRLGMTILTSHVAPWALFDLKPHVYTVSSQFGFEALLAGCKVSCFGVPFYAGWGLTDDRGPAMPRRTAKRSALDLAAAVYLRYSHYFDTWFREPIDALTAADQLAFLRRSYLANARPVTAWRIARWKRRAITAMLDGPLGPPRFVNALPQAIADARRRGGCIAAWGIDSIQQRPALETQGLAVMAVEDGFLRSVGLGAAFTQPVSLVFDTVGLYYDPTQPSGIEKLLSDDSFSPEELQRASAMRDWIVRERITKYNVRRLDAPQPDIPSGRLAVLVPGQVADDWAVQVGRPSAFPSGMNVNALLLERARANHPGAFVIFKPHPDVEHLGRAGALDESTLNAHADFVARTTPLENLLPVIGHMETYSSLAGFEALLRGIPVTVHGCPFYAGWGLTRDLAPVPRRGRTRTLNELAAAALLRYPRYWDPVSGLICTPEVALRRIAQSKSSKPALRQKAGVILGRGVIMLRRVIGTAGGRQK